MKRSSHLKKIENINADIEKIAGSELSSAQAQHQSHLNQLEQLKTYKQEYQEQFSQRANESISSSEVQNYQHFFTFLDSAISQQLSVIEQSNHQLEALTNNWLNKKQDTKRISRAADKMKSLEEVTAKKLEQEEVDELNQQKFQIRQGFK